MAAIAFDPLEYAHQLEASGISREQAEVHAKAMTAIFLHNFDALVTRDYLDTRFSEFESRIEASIEQRFFAVDQRFSEMKSEMDQRFSEMKSEVDRRFSEMESQMDRRFSELESRMDQGLTRTNSRIDQLMAGIDVRFERVDGKFRLLFWMQTLTMAAVVLPVLREFSG